MKNMLVLITGTYRPSKMTEARKVNNDRAAKGMKIFPIYDLDSPFSIAKIMNKVKNLPGAIIIAKNGDTEFDEGMFVSIIHAKDEAEFIDLKEVITEELVPLAKEVQAKKVAKKVTKKAAKKATKKVTKKS